MDTLTPGTYYQDILADGSRSKLRQNFKHLRRVSFDTKAAVVQTLQIEVTSIPLPELVLTPAQEEMAQQFGSVIEIKHSPELLEMLETSKYLQTQAYKRINGSKDLADLIEQTFRCTEEQMTKL